MFSKNIKFKNFKKNQSNAKVEKDLINLLNEKNEIINSLSSNYKNKYNFKKILKIKKNLELRIIGIGGSILGAKAIYDFLSVKKKILFIDNLNSRYKLKKKNYLNLIISKSGNTIETLTNVEIFLKKNDKNLFITENKDNKLKKLAQKLKSDVVEHNNFIGGRYSVLSEVGMLPAYLMGLPINNLRKNILVHLKKNKNKIFLKDSAVKLANILLRGKIKNLILFNYVPKLDKFLSWYQQIIAESLGKKGKGFLPTISQAPKDHHSLLQLYLDGPRDKLFYVLSSDLTSDKKINSNKLDKEFKYLNNKSLNQIKNAQKNSFLQNLKKKQIPFREFKIRSNDEQTLGELFSYFIIETAIVGKLININPFDQPAVENLKKATKKELF